MMFSRISTASPNRFITDSTQTRHHLLKMRLTQAMTLKESHALVSLMQVAVAQVGE